MNRVIGVLWWLAAASAVAAPAKDDVRRWSLETKEIRIRAIPRSPDQISGFYRARRLPESAIRALRRACLVTVGIHNRSHRVLWLEPARWRLQTVAGDPVRRLPRSYWQALWARLDVAAGARASFGWTLLPESRDLQPDEPVGGNLTLEPPGGPFIIEARFATGTDRRGPPLVLRSPPLTCPRDPVP